jgi:hypothetical protein
MRVSLLLASLPALALADASPPSRSLGVTPPTTIEYSRSTDGKNTISATEYAPGTPLFLVDGGPQRVVQRLHNGEYVVEFVGTRRTVPFVALTPFAFVVGTDSVTVGFSYDFKIHVRGGGGDELVLEPAGQGYMSVKGGNVSAELVEGAAPVPLIHVSSRPEACSDYWEIYVSLVDGVPRQALALYSIADPPTMSTSTVKFAGDTAVVTTRTAEDEKSAHTTRTRYRFDGRVFVDVSKRAATRSK